MKNAFTLVELSIVLVIIGLLTAGVVGGQSLIESAKMNKVLSDYTKYKTAINAFSLEYDALPGDMKNATDYWGAVASGCTTAAGTGTQTCNGDGDGHFEHDYGGTNSHEPYRAWQHLANSGIVPGNYSGVPVGTWGWVDGVTAPKGPMDTSFWVIKGAYGTASYGDYSGKNIQRNVMVLGKNPGGSGGSRYHYPVFTPKQMRNLDVKFDDGAPFTGIFTSYNGNYVGVCTSGTDLSPSATYALTTTTIVCGPHIDLGIGN